MHRLVLISILQVLAAAIPHPQASDDSTAPLTSISEILPTSTVAIPDSTSLNIPVTAIPSIEPVPDDDGEDDDDDNSGKSLSRSKKPHREPTPIFTKQCQCQLATARYPCWATDALQKCYFEENFSHACYMQAAGGCPKPTRACKQLYLPTPLPGPNPCELKPNPNPHVTPTLPAVPSFPTLTGAPNVTLSLPVAVPSRNSTLATVFSSGT
ncbi:hypothetical protein COCMIDRAFT_30709 [Bipolaris oryzae ATCC 44560]|uniref:Extracellular membrane protein CFEM domain-containing protein n=1 Tax=Bipolaris oryzae ATCC 44560 TaxID=930090 RepID=W6YXQ5_COCMI|nr:uncharacterized protein COCMIDRAFT_30709 [Bipolaris oryzae ATCC 44560]EUC40334.1 hypothetical protein COCMIDRAFT_30709 [Bipolaris oryzae ATCC 44560]